MTIYDIAKEAGVSISTVSRVLNNPKKVAPSTRKRVQEILNKHNYSPNAMARGLVHNSMKTIGILMSDICNIHFSTSAYVLEDCFFERDYTTFLCNTGDDLNKKKKYIRILAEKKVDGLVLLGSVFYEPEIEQLIKNYFPQTPVVISNGYLPLPNVYSVSVDHTVGMELIMEHLNLRGYEHIYFIRTNMSLNTQRKMTGFIQAMKKYKKPINDKNNILYCECSPEGAMEFAKSFLPLARKKTACIFYDDYIANFGINAFKNLGLSIPEDVAIVGFDNLRFAVTANPRLTSIDAKVEEIARVIANTLHDIFMKKTVGNSILVYPELIIREST